MGKLAYLTWHQDGLIDMFIGIALVVLALSLGVDNVAVGSGAVAIVILLYFTSKKQMTIPRIHDRKLADVIRTRSAWLADKGLYFLLFFFASSFIIFQSAMLYPGWGWVFDEYSAIIVGGFGSALFGLSAYFLNISRFYNYCTITLIVFVVGHILNTPLYLDLLVLGLPLMFYGTILVYRFAHENSIRTHFY
jgi:hypothetical protein